jgi:Protein of unknown function (DUF2384)
MPALQMQVANFNDPGKPYLSARGVAEGLGVTLSELASLAGIARNTLTAKSGARKVDEALSSIVRILAIVSEMTGGQDRAAIWFKHQPIPGWAGKTAYDLVKEQKADKILAYLEAVKAGTYA